MSKRTAISARVTSGLVCLCLLSPGALAQGQATSAPASAPFAPGAWAPADLAERLKAGPKTDLDGQILELLGECQGRMAQLKPDDALARGYLPRLQRKLVVLAQEYNLDKKRYPGDCYPAADCLKDIATEMTFWLDTLAKGQDPGGLAKGRWQRKVVWVERMNILCHYDLIGSSQYDPATPSPLILSYQDDPDMNQVRRTPYFLVRCIQQGYPKGLTNVENKTRSILKDVAADFNIDPLRVYATGFSYGGHTDLVVAWRHPHWFAAIAPVCNDLRDETTPYVKYLKNVPTLLIHGTGDSFLQTGGKVHEYMKEGGCNVAFLTYPGGHDPRGQNGAGPFAKVSTLTDFFDQYAMAPFPRTVSHVVEHPRYSRAFWVDGKLVKVGGGAGTFEVRARDGNRIEVDANEHVAELDLYLNDKLVDMSKPVTVVSGDKALYEGKPSEKLTVKLRDSEEPSQKTGNDTLWQEMMEIRQAAGFGGQVGKLPPRTTTAPATASAPARD